MGLGFALRLTGLSEYWLNPDEGIYYSTLTRASSREFWGEVMANAHPPAFYLLLRGLGSLTWDFVWLRGASLVFGTLAIWIFWLVGREVGGKGWAGVASGLVTAGLLAVNGEAIVFSQVLRPYMLLVALLGAALYHLLKYREEPSGRHLVAYVVFTSLALLTHYSAALALGAFFSLAAYDYFTETIDRLSAKKLAIANAIPAACFLALFQLHLAASMNSYMMYLALAPDGWLSEWLVASPADVWKSFVTFQTLHLPVAFQARSAILVLAAVGLSAFSRDRLVSVLTGGALVVAVLASSTGFYPFGPTRHNAWLIVFTFPAVGWLVGRVVQRGRIAVLATSGAIASALILGGPIEAALGDYPPAGSTAEERAIRQDDLRSLLVERLDPAAEPRTILMSFQTFNLLMPLYATERQELIVGSRPDLFAFSFGSRNVVVVGQWDWAAWADVGVVVDTLPTRLPSIAGDRPEGILLIAGGWESSLFSEADARRSIGDPTTVLGTDLLGRPVTRLMAFDLNVGR